LNDVFVMQIAVEQYLGRRIGLDLLEVEFGIRHKFDHKVVGIVVSTRSSKCQLDPVGIGWENRRVRRTDRKRCDQFAANPSPIAFVRNCLQNFPWNDPFEEERLRFAVNVQEPARVAPVVCLKSRGLRVT
jgi:hypothetical protein